MENIREILTDLGYSLMELPKEYRARPIYRESGNSTSLRINKSTGNWRDYGLGIGGSFSDLVKITLNLKSVDEANTYLQTKFNVVVKSQARPRPELKGVKIFENELLTKLLPQHEYWIERGISLKTLKMFEGGLCLSGKMARRYVFPIFNSKRQIIGFSGRDLTGKSPIKWKHIGQKTEWKYPLFVNFTEIEDSREVILVESIGDALSLYEVGIQNFMVTFGVELSLAILNQLLRLDPNRIIIALNNEPDNNSIGNKASEKISHILGRHFDEKQIKIALPPRKDFNDMLQSDKNSIGEWYGNIT